MECQPAGERDREDGQERGKKRVRVEGVGEEVSRDAGARLPGVNLSLGVSDRAGVVDQRDPLSGHSGLDHDGVRSAVGHRLEDRVRDVGWTQFSDDAHAVRGEAHHSEDVHHVPNPVAFPEGGVGGSSRGRVQSLGETNPHNPHGYLLSKKIEEPAGA